MDQAAQPTLAAGRERRDEIVDVVPWRVDVMTSGAARRGMSHVLDEAVPL